MVFFWHKNMGLPETRVIMAMAGKSPQCVVQDEHRHVNHCKA